eukprot:154298-Amphidinium_carterae.1
MRSWKRGVSSLAGRMRAPCPQITSCQCRDQCCRPAVDHLLTEVFKQSSPFSPLLKGCRATVRVSLAVCLCYFGPASLATDPQRPCRGHHRQRQWCSPEFSILPLRDGTTVQVSELLTGAFSENRRTAPGLLQTMLECRLMLKLQQHIVVAYLQEYQFARDRSRKFTGPTNAAYSLVRISSHGQSLQELRSSTA